MTNLSAAERATLRTLISEKKKLEFAGQPESDCPSGYASTTGFRKGCRCTRCRQATSAARNDRRRRAKSGETVPPRRPWTRDGALAAVAAFAERRGYQPVSNEAGPANRLPCFAAASRLFGSWNAMIEAAGFEPYPAQSSEQAKTLAYRDRHQAVA